MHEFSRTARTAAGLAAGLLGWRPEEFWSATLMELLTALDGRLGNGASVPPVASCDLARLKERFPDG